MKKLLIMLALILMLGSITAYANEQVPERVRIGLKYGSTAISSASVTSDDGFDVAAKGNSDSVIGSFLEKSVTVDITDSAFVVTKEFGSDYQSAVDYCNETGDSLLYRLGNYYAVIENLYTGEAAQTALSNAQAINPSAYIIQANMQKTRVKDTNGRTLLIFAQDSGETLALASKDGGTIGFSGLKYREYLEFKRGNTSIDVISNISMQAYLYGVVPSEIGGSAPIEAQKAQAVCARTYAVKNLNRHSKNGFNLCATTCCQVYFGIKNETNLSNRAVDETEGKVITYNGELITAVYSAHSGGITANVENVWGSPYPYLKSVNDPHCTDYTWTVDLDYDVITSSLNAKGYNLGTVIDIKINSTSSDNRVTKMTITGTNGTKVVERESARTILGLKSQCFYIADGTLTRSVLSASGVNSCDIIKKSILTANGTKTTGNSVAVKNGNGNITTLFATSGSKIVGTGYGHGVGLSQCGAMGFAKEGWDYIKILKHYYTGVEVE